MTRDQVVDLICQRLVRRAGDSDLVSGIIAELNLAQQTVCERGLIKPWFLLNISTVTVDATGWKAPLPADFIDLFEEAPAVIWATSAATPGLQPLERIGRSDLEWSQTPVNTVSNYDVMEGYLILGKQMTSGDTLRILYYKSESLPTGDYGSVGQPSPNRWYQYAPDVLIGEAGAIVAGTKLRDDKIQMRLEAIAAKAWNRLNAETISKAEMAKERFLSGALYPVTGPTRTITSLA